MPPPPATPGAVRVEVTLRPADVLAGWRPDVRRLVLVTSEPLRKEQRVAAHVAIAGTKVAVTITGRVAAVAQRDGRTSIELVPDETRVRAVERLVEVARGASVAYPPRAPRYLATLPAIVQGAGGPMYLNTFSVSERGCGLAWSGPVPPVGAPLEVRLGAGKQVASFRAVVAWTSRSGRAATVGVKFVAGHAAAWATMFQDVRRSGAPPA